MDAVGVLPQRLRVTTVHEQAGAGGARHRAHLPEETLDVPSRETGLAQLHHPEPAGQGAFEPPEEHVAAERARLAERKSVLEEAGYAVLTASKPMYAKKTPATPFNTPLKPLGMKGDQFSGFT